MLLVRNAFQDAFLGRDPLDAALERRGILREHLPRGIAHPELGILAVLANPGTARPESPVPSAVTRP